MTTDRPYSKAMTSEAAIARLRFLAGKKFDLPCVEAMERASAGGDLAPGQGATCGHAWPGKRERAARCTPWLPGP